MPQRLRNQKSFAGGVGLDPLEVLMTAQKHVGAVGVIIELGVVASVTD